MNKQDDRPKQNPLEEQTKSSKSQMRQYIDAFSNNFNTLSQRTKQVSLMACGIAIACTCIVLILQAIYGQTNAKVTVDQITLPNDIYMNNQSEEKLTPLGKMKGELDGEFEAFHVAADHTGQLFINRNPEFSKDSLNKSKGWEAITQKQLEVYEKQLHFIPHRKKGLRH